MPIEIIEAIHKRKTTFPAPEEAIDKANACNALSRDIYTDNTRFIYELLQNADDASCKSCSLTFNLEFVGDYLIVSHKGKAFDENDVESICSIGDGSKSADSEQTGFKGIGFKSVFAYSDLVIIKSGDFCFKFDKEESNNFWDDKWENKCSWQQMRRSKGKTDKVSMPWQIIPINTDIPQVIPVNKFSGYAVSTIIKCKKVAELKESVQKLFSSAQLILFLRSKNVNVILNTGSLLQIEKRTTNDITTISKNGEVISQWLMHTTIPFDVPSHIREQMEEDKDHYPEKLREATKASISFAISLEKGKIEKLDNETNNIYSFLPTTVNSYDFPFIVNSNFITDAGRQNLHQDYVWNQWLLEEMPKHYLTWIGKIAKEGKYGLDFLKVIATKSGAYDELGRAYDKGMADALATISILPNNGTLLKVSEAVFDKTLISDYIDKNIVIAYLCTKDDKYRLSKLLDSTYMPYYTKLDNLGVMVFKEDDLKELISSDTFSNAQNETENTRLIKFLSHRYDLVDDKEETISWLQQTPFLLSDNGNLLTPKQLCFPNITANENNDVDIISKTVYNSLSNDEISWLRQIGVSEISDTSLIDTGKLFEEGFVTPENAIEIGRFLYRLYEKAKLEDNHFDRLKQLKLLSQKGSLITASHSYLANIYQPTDKIEDFCEENMFVSSQYLPTNHNLSQWKLFFEKLGVADSISLQYRRFSREDAVKTFVWAEEFWKNNSTQPNTYNGVWNNPISYYTLYLHTMFEHVPSSYSFSLIFWNAILKQSFNRDNNDQGRSSFGYQDPPYLKENFFEWCIANMPIIPTSLNKCELALNVYVNDLPIDLSAYLPVIRIDFPLSQEWRNILKLKTTFEISDLLDVLTQLQLHIYEDSSARNIIQAIYTYISNRLLYLTDVETQSIQQWASTHKLLAKDNNFYYPSELSYITIPGFNAQKEIYAESVDADMLKLFRLFGVTVIDNFDTNIVGEAQEDNLKKRLYDSAPLLAILSKKDRSFRDEVNKIKERISELSIMHASSIQLTYGDNNDVQERTTFYDSDKKYFYFTGDWEKPRVIMNLVEPLCEILHIKKSYTNLLSVILSEPNFNDNKKYLEENGFDISYVTEEYLPVVSTTFKGLSAREEIELINGDIQEGNMPSDGVGGDRRISYAEEAQKRIMELLKQNDCSYDNGNHSYTVLYSIKRPDGTSSKAIMKSAKGGYLYFTPREWLELACDNAMLLIVDQNNQVRNVRLEELEESNDHFHMRFDTQVFAVRSNLKVFAQFFRPLPQGSAYFVFSVPYGFSKANYLEEFGLDKQNTSAIEVTNDDINMLS